MRKARGRVIRSLFTICFAGLLATSSQAVIIASDTFDYGFGSIVRQSGGFGWGGVWIGGTSAGRSYTVSEGIFTAPDGYTFDVSSPYLALGHGGATAQASRMLEKSFSLNPPSPETYYFSTLVSVFDNGTASDARYFPRLIGAENTPIVNFGVGGDKRPRINIGLSTTGSAYMADGADFAAATQYLTIGKMVLNPNGTPDEFNFSVFESFSDVPATEPMVWDVTRFQELSDTITGFAFATGANAGTLNVDNFYFGTDYASVIEKP